MSTSSTVSAGPLFQTLSINSVQDGLIDLYRRVACEQGRVEITSDDGICACVLISKTELDGLERALSILSDSSAVNELSDRLADLAAVAEPTAAV